MILNIFNNSKILFLVFHSCLDKLHLGPDRFVLRFPSVLNTIFLNFFIRVFWDIWNYKDLFSYMTDKGNKVNLGENTTNDRVNSNLTKSYPFINSPLQSSFIDIEMFLSLFKLFLDFLGNITKILNISINYFYYDFPKGIINIFILLYSIFSLKGESFFSKFFGIIYINLKKYLINYIYKYIIYIKDNFINILIINFEILMNNINEDGLYYSMKNIILIFYKNIFHKNNHQDLYIFLYCWAFTLCFTSIDILMELGKWIFLFSNFIALLDFTFWFITNDKIQKTYPELHELGEIFLFSLFFIFGFYLIYLFLNILKIFFLKFNTLIKILEKRIEDFILKITPRSTEDQNISSSSKEKGNNQRPPKRPTEGVTNSPRKRKKNRSASEIKISQDELKKTISQNIGESDKDYDKRIAKLEATRHYKKTNREKVLEAHREYNKKNKEKINENNYAYFKEHNDSINEERRKQYKENPEVKEARLGGFHAYYHSLSREEKDLRNDLRSKRRNKQKTMDMYYHEESRMLSKNSPLYYRHLGLLLELNKDKTLSSMINFSEKPKEDTPEIIKALYELKKEDPGLFKKGRPGETLINDDFLNKVKNKDNK